jgi:hypothetical protein
MNKPKCPEIDHINFLVASQKLYSWCGAEKVLSYTSNAVIFYGRSYQK